jgi:predicted Zn-ribbon and HTH transcriptional regulator
MKRPPVEVADIVRTCGASFIERSRRWLHWSHVKVLHAISRCRTAALGGHRDQCSQCGHQTISYNSCRNRHCPKCQTAARDRWVAKRQTEVLPVGYFHVVFTLPHELSALALQNKNEIYRLLLQASADTLLEVAADPQHLGATIGFLSILHTWGQNLLHHPHVHCVVPGGGISPDHTHWIHSRPKFLVPVPVLKLRFRAKVRDGLKRLFRARKLVFAGQLAPLSEWKAFLAFLRPVCEKEWVVYAKAPFRGSHHLLHYLARYTHRVAISNHRLIAFDGESVTFRWKDYAHGNKKRKMTISADEFLRRFLLHTLPRGFVRIRFFGFLAGPHRSRMLQLARHLLEGGPAEAGPPSLPARALFHCPVCDGPMTVVERLTGARLRRLARLHQDAFTDSS